MSMLRRPSLWRWHRSFNVVACAAVLTLPWFSAQAAQPVTPDIIRDKRWLLVLAHLDDKVEGADDAAYRDAIRAFQASQGLPRTGRLTSADRQLLAERAQIVEERAGFQWIVCDRTGIELRVPLRLAPRQQVGPRSRQWQSADGQFRIETFKFTANERVASLRQRLAPGRSLWEDADDNAEVSVETLSGSRYILFKAYKGAREIRAVRVSFDVSQKERYNAAMNVIGDSITPFPAPDPKRQISKSPEGRAPETKRPLTRPRTGALPRVATVAPPPNAAPQRSEPARVPPPEAPAPQPKPAPQVSESIKINPPPQESVTISPAPPLPSPGVPQNRFGTGFIINRIGQVVTTEQNIRGCIALTARAAGSTGAARVRYSDPANDLAVLEVTGLNDRSPLALARADTTRAAVESVVVLGYSQPDPPGSGGLTATQGNVRAAKTDDSAPQRIAGANLPLQFSGTLKSGHTGGPMLDPFGRVVGVATSDSGRSKAPVSAVNLETIVAFLKTANVPFTATAASWVVRGDVVVEEAKAGVVQVICDLPVSAKAK
jgi:S1-C subfamily serine protease